MRKQVLFAAVALFALTGAARAYDPADLPAGCANPSKEITKHYCDLMVTAIKADEMKNAAVEKTKEGATWLKEKSVQAYEKAKEKLGK